MSYLREVELGWAFPPFADLRGRFGFVPSFFRAQSLVPRLIEAQTEIFAALFAAKALSRIQKERLILSVAAAQRSSYWITLQYQTLLLLGVAEEQVEQIIADHGTASVSPADIALLEFIFQLCSCGFVSRRDLDECFSSGWTDEMILEAVVTAAWAKFVCTIAAGLGVVPDFEPLEIPARPFSFPTRTKPDESIESSQPILQSLESNPNDVTLLSSLHKEFGFIPRVFALQMSRPDLLQAELSLIRSLLSTEDLLTRRQKQCVLLAVSAANRNGYWVTALTEMLRTSGVLIEQSEQIALDHRQTSLSSVDKALLDFACKLSGHPPELCREDVDTLRNLGFSQEQILEEVVTAALGNFLEILQVGLLAGPDFPPRRTFQVGLSKTVHFSASDSHPTQQGIAPDPDADSVARVQAGDLDAFEDLMKRHSQRVYRTLVGVLGNREEARDAMQETFLKAFQHISEFQRRSKFSTWLVSIATNTALQVVRDRRPHQSISDEAFEEGFRPREIRAWSDDPEQQYSKAETRELVEENVMRLPAKYRVVLLLREIEQLPMDEAAAALGLTLAAFKARLLRGRLMLREALASHFTAAVRESVT